jgi:hypothetical protein
MYQRQAPSPQATQAARPTSSVAAGASKGPIVSMLEVSLHRLEEIVDQETAALRERRAVDLKEFNDRKSQALLELTRMMRAMQGTETSPDMAARVHSLRHKLAVNQQVLKMHLEAVREISTSLSDAIRHADSDGTYTQSISSASRRA